jgi:hypothetical protein
MGALPLPLAKRVCGQCIFWILCVLSSVWCPTALYCRYSGPGSFFDSNAETASSWEG